MATFKFQDDIKSRLDFQNIIDIKKRTHAPSQIEDILQHIASDIIIYNNDNAETLKTISEGLNSIITNLKSNIPYIIETNQQQPQKLLKCNFVVDFLILLGFRIKAKTEINDAYLVCDKVPRDLILKYAEKSVRMLQQRGIELQSRNDNNLSLQQIISWNDPNDPSNDTDTINRLLMIYPMKWTSIEMIQSIKSKFDISIPKEILNGDEVKLKEFNNNIRWRSQIKAISHLRRWLKTYFYEDWNGNDKLQNEFKSWILEMEQYSTLYPEYPKSSTIEMKLKVVIEKEFEKCKKEQQIEQQHQQQPQQYKENNQYNQYLDTSQVSIKQIGSNISKLLQELFFKIRPREYIENILHSRIFSYSNVYFDDKKGKYMICCDNENELNCPQKKIIITIIKYWSNKNIVDDILLIIMDFCKAFNGNKTNKRNNAMNIISFAKTSNSLKKYFQLEILKADKRSNALQRIIRFGQVFEDILHDYNTLFILFSALKSKPIQRLKKEWKMIESTKINKLIKHWEIIFDPYLNFRNLRIFMLRLGGDSFHHLGVFINGLLPIYNQIYNHYYMDIQLLNQIYHSIDSMHKMMRFMQQQTISPVDNKVIMKSLIFELDQMQNISEQEIDSLV